MNKTIYGNKLAHYAKREPKRLLQLDAFYMPHNDDPDLHPDKDGDVLMAGGTLELMQEAEVRVLIPTSTDKKMAVRQLKKITKWLSKDSAKWLSKNSDLFDLAKPLKKGSTTWI